MKEELPSVGKMVVTSLGDGKVVGLNAGSRTVHVQLFEIGKVKELPLDDVVVK
ncbi:hypothetical protein D3C73_1566980 [compost metagenome]